MQPDFKDKDTDVAAAATERSDDIAENIEQSQESTAPAHAVDGNALSGVYRLAGDLMARLLTVPDGDLVAEVVETAVKLLRDQTNRGDLKLISKSLKEIRYSLKVFAPYRETRKISIFGSARTPEDHADYRAAELFAKMMAKHGWMVTTGAGGGIMAAGHGGAGADPSFGLAIRLPFEQSTNVHIARDKKLINFKYFFTRKLMFVRSSHAIALFPGGFGTMDEGFEVLTLIQTGKSVPMPIVYIDPPGGTFWRKWLEYVEQELLTGRRLINPDDLRLFKVTDDVEEAVREVVKFYSNYHSVRYVRNDLAIRLHRRPTEAQLAAINDKFRHLSTGGPFTVGGPLPAERDEPALAAMPRLVFAFNKRDHGGLRILIDHLNDLP